MVENVCEEFSCDCEPPIDIIKTEQLEFDLAL